MGDPRYALLNAKRLCEMVIDVLVASELLQQAAALRGQARRSPRASSTAACSVVEMNARRISGGDASRIQRYDTILGLDAAE